MIHVRAAFRLFSAALCALLSVACVGPSRTASDYERKVANSAEAVVSAAESALLTVEVAEDGKATVVLLAWTEFLILFAVLLYFVLWRR